MIAPCDLSSQWWSGTSSNRTRESLRWWNCLICWLRRIMQRTAVQCLQCRVGQPIASRPTMAVSMEAMATSLKWKTLQVAQYSGRKWFRRIEVVCTSRWKDQNKSRTCSLQAPSSSSTRRALIACPPRSRSHPSKVQCSLSRGRALCRFIIRLFRWKIARITFSRIL